ncbi:hypothetical protein [Plantactinospora soyae]|uniref:Secreted protein n=1 Tax=Plantactinospora soyae TaxID=1544732 RepID=A0A927R2S5_9ACTN|nr:hypothetical protein [Plantactinospora soyae]MBE1484829.1 hypothetical protein [Plantactinospora soyae]
MPSSRSVVIAALILTAMSACTRTSGETCYLIDVPRGIGITVDAAIAERVDTAEMTVCWNGSCQTPPVVLRPSSGSVDEDCTGSGPDAVCAARAEPTGEKAGFANLPDMPSSPVEVTVTLTDQAGDRIVDRTLTLDPKMVDSPGECGGMRPQGQIAVNADGTAQVVG